MGSIPAVSVLNLHKSFGGKKVLNGISFLAQDHDVISIIGSSGSGKSTLLRCINLLEMPDEGEIRIKDELLEIQRGGVYSRPAREKQIRRLRSRLGMVFQNFNLWSHRTVIENVTEALIYVQAMPRRQAIEKGEMLLDKVGLYSKRNEYPLTLSGGEKQRAGIARALAIDPQVLLFDEPTSALDPELVGDVLNVIATLADEGRTMLLVTHEMKFARDVSTHVIFINNGQIGEQGKPEEVLVKPRTEALAKFIGAAHA